MRLAVRLRKKGVSMKRRADVKDADNRCKEARTKCTVTAIHDVRQPGDWTLDSLATLKAAAAK
jgi:hypothetical protein